MRLRSRLIGAAVLLAASLLGFDAEAGTVVTQSFASPTLGYHWNYNVYLPDSYGDGKKRYPVFYLLHSAGGDRDEWVKEGGIQETADEMMRRGDIPEAVIVMPSADTTWYVDRKENMETAIIRDLIPEVEKNFRVMTDRAGRVIGGASMGGYGALRFVLKYPEMFAAAALMSPAIYVPEPPSGSAARDSGVFIGPDGQFDAEVWKSFNYPALLDAFFAKNIAMPVHVDSGDHDGLRIEGQAAQFYEIWREHDEPGELRIVAGGHSYAVWETTVREAMRFIFKTVRRPEPIN